MEKNKRCELVFIKPEKEDLIECEKQDLVAFDDEPYQPDGKEDGKDLVIFDDDADSLNSLESVMNLPVMDEFRGQLGKISSRMPTIDHGVMQIGKQNSQTTTSLMSLNMIDMGPYRVLRQILAQIEKKKAALVYNSYKLSNTKLIIAELVKKKEEGIISEKELLRLKKKKAELDSARPYVFATIREMGALQDRYYEIMESHNIPELWSEKDAEEEEVKHHIKCIFRNAIRDRMARNCNQGTMEYMEQFGIEPVLAYAIVDAWILRTQDNIISLDGKSGYSIENRYKFYDKMYELFKDEYKKALERLGLKSATFDEWLIRSSDR